LGVDHIDTAQFYGPDVVNDLIRDTLHPYPDNLKLVTKVGARRDGDGGWLAAQRPDELRAGVEANLASLRVERMDLVNLRLHDDGHGDGGDEGDSSGSGDLLADQLGVLDEMRDEGKLDLVGVSTISLAELRRAVDLCDIAGVQNAYSILDRSDEDVLSFCVSRNMAYVPYFPLGSAFTGGPAKLAEDAAISATATKHGVSPSQIALAWLLAKDDHVLLIPGTNSVAHLEENLAAGDVALDADDLELLAGVAG
jgi:aryl-alcohol dehydrogenase-like predicted oxidoreductase